MAQCAAPDSVAGIMTLYLKAHLTEIFDKVVHVAAARNQLRLDDVRHVSASLEYTHGSFHFDWCLDSRSRELTRGQRLFVSVQPKEHFFGNS